MKMADYIRENRAELVDIIGQCLGRVPKTASCYCPKSGTDHQHPAPKLTTADIKEWIMNDETLYRCARSCGVRI
jgi:hypothetical protein